jgi:hypothetical protein
MKRIRSDSGSLPLEQRLWPTGMELGYLRSTGSNDPDNMHDGKVEANVSVCDYEMAV